jgi:hypothetical protein
MICYGGINRNHFAVGLTLCNVNPGSGALGLSYSESAIAGKVIGIIGGNEMKYLALATTLALSTCAPAYAQQMCGGMVGFIKAMSEGKFSQMATGDLSGGEEMQIWATDQGVYIVAVVNVSHVCIVAVGNNYQEKAGGGDL